MKFLKIGAGVLLVVLLIAAYVAPIGPMPGFLIGGSDTPVPANWDDTSSLDEIRLSVGEGLLPRVVIIWVVQVAGDLYVVGGKDSGWMQAIGTGGPAHLRMGDKTYDVTTEPVSEGWQPILIAWRDKYAPNYPDIVAGFPSMEEAEDVMQVVKLAKGSR